MIYISKDVVDKLDEYAAFLRYSVSYTGDEAKTRKWEVEYQISQRCNPILMKPGSSGTIKFKSVLQRQEITRFVNNKVQLARIIKRRRGNKGSTQWNVDYFVSPDGDVFIGAIKCYNSLYESVASIDRELFEHFDNSHSHNQINRISNAPFSEKPDIYKENKQNNTMNNTKTRIRLTESQLIQIIREAVDEWSADDETWRCKYDPNYDCGDKSPIGQHIDKHFDYNTADAAYGIGGQKRLQRAEAASVRDELADKERYFKSNPNARMNDGGPHFFATPNGQR